MNTVHLPVLRNAEVSCDHVSQPLRFVLHGWWYPMGCKARPGATCQVQHNRYGTNTCCLCLCGLT